MILQLARSACWMGIRASWRLTWATLTLEEVVERGRHLFTASFNTLDGAGRPETTDVNQNNFRPPHVFPDNFNRISGPDANACSSCHGVPRIGGGGDNATNVFVLADRLAFVNFDGERGRRDEAADAEDCRERADVAGSVRVGGDRAAGTGDDVGPARDSGRGEAGGVEERR